MNDERIFRFIRNCNRLNAKCTNKRLSFWFNLTEREVRKTMHELRKTHIIWNLQDGRGYIIGETDTEEGNRLNDLWLKQEDSRAIQNFAHSKYARSQRKNPNQMDMYINKLTNEEYEEEKQC